MRQLPSKKSRLNPDVILSFNSTNTFSREATMDKYECPCGYVYDPAVGDIDNNIPTETAFEDLPDDWVCPLCGAEKDYFEKVD